MHFTSEEKSRASQETLLLQHRVDDGISTPKQSEEFVGGLRVAGAVDVLAAPVGHFLVEDAATLEEGIESIRIEHLCPKIDVVAGGVVSRSKEVQKVGRAVSHDDALGHMQTL
tara:strand:+ start:312 stop:650 length:339 start_codon:yes stop_codon:yes gene_type:complete